LKIQIKSVKTLIPGGFYWRVTIDGKTTNYADAAGAYTYAKKYLKRYYKESAAFSMVSRLSINLLSESEASIVKKLRRTKCKGLTAKQYGYLTGIYERQMREW
jgi:hypothetical protein